MKRFYTTLIAALTILLVMGSCADILNLPDRAGVSPEKGRLAFRIEGAARTVLPAGIFDKYVLRFEYDGAEGYDHADTEWSAGVSIDLEPGDWTIHADAYSGETVVGTGSAAARVDAGSVTPVTIRIRAIKTGPGIRGTLKYTISYPEDSADHAYVPDDLQVFSVEEWLDGVETPVTTIPVTNGAEGTRELDAGMYGVYISIEDTPQRTAVSRLKMVHIYGGQDTVLDIAVGADEFTAIIPVTGTAKFTAPSWLTVNSRVIRVYSDADCTEPVQAGTPQALSTAGGLENFTLRVPSALEEIYFRQELAVQSGSRTLTLTGGIRYVWIEGNGAPVQSGVHLDDAFYGVRVDDGVSGTLTAEPFAAPAGADITLTPDAGYVIKAGTLTYNGTVVTGGPPYTFTMPAADVTVRAELVTGNTVRYVKANGDGDGLSWGTASGDLQKMMDELADLKSEGSTGPFVVKAAGGKYTPKYKPNGDGTTDYDTPAGDRDSTFILRAGVEIRGGYDADGGEGEEDARKIRFNTDGTIKKPEFADYETILSGDFNGDDDITGNGENAYRVVYGSGIPAGSGTVLDGLTISGGNNGSGPGGGMYNNDSSPALTNVTISGNTASGSGGGMYNYNSSPELDTVTIADNTASTGGGMYNYNSSPTLKNGSSITGNRTTSGGGGGGMYNSSGSSPELDTVTIEDNTATFGGGMYNSDSSPMLTSVTITGNTSTGFGSDGGGGMKNNNSSPVLDTVTIKNNTAIDFGGGMYNGSGSSPALTNVTIENNTATFGGGMYNGSGSSPTLTGGSITGNTATSGSGSGQGGGMYNSGSSPVLAGVTITGNTATGNGVSGDGGGMYNNNSSPALINAAVSGNKARSGGGMYNNNSPPALINVLVSGNTAEDGGGMFNSASSPVLINVTIAGNYAGTGGGGGMYNMASSNPAIKNSVIYGNTAQGGGAAGIYNVAYEPSTPVISYSLVQGSGGSGSWDPEAGTDGGNNLDEDPKFVNPDPASSGSPKTGGSYLLTVENVGTIYEIVSPAVNAGDNNSYPNTWAKWEALTGAGGISTEEKYNTYIAPHIGNDLDDHIRIQNPAEGGIIDMGAYENG